MWVACSAAWLFTAFNVDDEMNLMLIISAKHDLIKIRFRCKLLLPRTDVIKEIVQMKTPWMHSECLFVLIHALNEFHFKTWVMAVSLNCSIFGSCACMFVHCFFLSISMQCSVISLAPHFTPMNINRFFCFVLLNFHHISVKYYTTLHVWAPSTIILYR